MERKELLVIVMVGVLLLVTGMQTVTLAGMATGSVSAPVKSTTSSASSGSSSVGSSGSSASSLDNLPSMVGGC